MSDATSNAANSPSPQHDAKKAASSPLGGLLIPRLLILAAAAVFAVFYFFNEKPTPIPPGNILSGYVVAAEKYGSLDAAKFKDANGDLIADTPGDAKAPAALFFCEIPGPNPDNDEQTWQAFLEHMTRATGLPCKYLKQVDLPQAQPEKRDSDREGDEGGAAGADGSIKSFDAQLKAMEDGHLHITAFTTGQVRQAVNTVGFRPLVVPADKSGKFTYQVKVLVPTNSTAKGIADLKGKKLAVTGLSSNSSAKAPFTIFHDEFKLFPTKDYSVSLPGRYEAALAQLVKGEADAVCIASDLLARELARGEPSDEEKKRGWVKLTEDKFKVLETFKGEYPKLCFGVSHTLPEPLVDKIKAGFASFKFEGKVGAKYASDGVTQFQLVDYKEHWRAVRDVDDRLAVIVKGAK